MVLFMRFFLLFPCSSAIERKAPWLKRWGLVTSLIFATWNLTYWYATQKNRSFFTDLFVPMQWLDTVQDILYVALFLVGLASLGLNLRDAKTPDERRRLGLLLGGSLGILPCLMYWLGTVTAGLRLPFILVTLMLIFSFSFPVCFLVAIVKHRIFGIRFILRRGLQFALLSRGVLVLEGLAIFLLLYFAAAPTLAAALGGAGQSLVAIATAGAAAAAVMGIRQINRRVMPRIEKRFFREAYDTRRILTGLTLGVRRFVTDPEALAEAVTRTVSDALHPAGAVLFLRGSRALELPWDSERIRALRRDAAGTASGDFLLVWPRDIGGGTAVLRGGSLTVRLLEECAMGDPSVLDVDAGRARSRWPLIRSQGSEEEKALLEGLDAHLLVPMAVEDRLTGFLLLGDKLSEEPYSREDGELLLAVAQQAADTLDHAGLLRQSQEQAQLKREVEIAMQVQENLLPREVIPVPNIEYAGACRPARYVGGDYYDFILRGGGRLVLALGDISGKGVSAALLMANLQANLRVQADLHGDRLEDVVSAINQRLCAATGESRFATLFYGIFDSQKRTLDYVNAGHNPPILYRASAGQRALSQLDPTGSILGIFGDLEYRRHAVQLEPGDLLLVYSDGATEAMNEAEEFYGEERLRELVLQLAQRPPREVVEGVLADVARFSGEHAQADDITLIAARIL
jgi:sigma-B regulation protein RsbU (phosphoserine phosphatase)